MDNRANEQQALITNPIIIRLKEILITEQTKYNKAVIEKNSAKSALHNSKISGLEKLISELKDSTVLIEDLKVFISNAVQSHPRLTEGVFSTIEKYFNEIAPGWGKASTQKKVEPTNLFSPVPTLESKPDLSDIRIVFRVTNLHDGRNMLEKTGFLDFLNRSGFSKYCLETYGSNNNSEDAFIFECEIFKGRAEFHWNDPTEANKKRIIFCLPGQIGTSKSNQYSYYTCYVNNDRDENKPFSLLNQSGLLRCVIDAITNEMKSNLKAPSLPDNLNKLGK